MRYGRDGKSLVTRINNHPSIDGHSSKGKFFIFNPKYPKTIKDYPEGLYFARITDEAENVGFLDIEEAKIPSLDSIIDMIATKFNRYIDFRNSKVDIYKHETTGREIWLSGFSDFVVSKDASDYVTIANINDFIGNVPIGWKHCGRKSIESLCFERKLSILPSEIISRSTSTIEWVTHIKSGYVETHLLLNVDLSDITKRLKGIDKKCNIELLSELVELNVLRFDRIITNDCLPVRVYIDPDMLYKLIDFSKEEVNSIIESLNTLNSELQQYIKGKIPLNIIRT